MKRLFTLLCGVIALSISAIASPPITSTPRASGLQAGNFFKTEFLNQGAQTNTSKKAPETSPRGTTSATAAKVASVKGTTIYGICRDGSKSSISSFVVADNISITEEKNLTNLGMDRISTGCYDGTNYIIMGIQFGSMDAFYPFLKDNDWSTGTIANGMFYPCTNAVELAYDKASSTTYGIIADGTTSKLGTLDFGKQKYDATANLALDRQYITLSINSAGQTYAISADGNLYTIDKASGETALVGATGVSPGADPSTACFCEGNDALLWIESEVLYAVDTTNGVATKVADVPGSWSGIFAEPGTTTASPATTIYGIQRDGSKASIASFVVSDNITVTQEKDMSEGTGMTWDSWRTGCYDGTDFTAMANYAGFADAYYPFNKSNAWSVGANNMFYPPINPIELAYDPTTETIYGIFTKDSAYKLGKVDFKLQQNAEIADLDQKYITLSFNSAGQAYAISADGKLYTLNKESGAKTLVGATDVTPGTNYSTACFNPEGDALLWIESNVLYSVDPASGKATRIAAVPGSWSGIFAESSEAAEKVTPNWVDDMRITFNKDALTGEVSFLMPTTGIGGTLTGPLTYHVFVDEVEVATDQAQPGALVSVPQTLSQGKHVFKVYAAKDGNPGLPSTQTKFIGHDTPTAPKNLTVTDNNGVILIQWDPVTTGVEGGYVSTETMMYTVVRNPGNVQITQTLQTTAADQSLPSMGNYSYAVTPYDLTNTGASTESETMLLGQSIGIVPPYNFGFAAEGMGLFTQLNANNDDYKWTYDTAEKIVWLPSNPRSATDDWLISPPIKLAEGNYYTLAVSLIASMYNERQQFEIRMGKSATIEGMSEVIYNSRLFSSSIDIKQRLQPREAGEYYFGIHVTTPAVDGAIAITNFNISTGIHKDSPAASRITATTAAEQGGKSATIEFITPTTTYSGDPLVSISKAVVKNITTGRIVEEFVNPEKGKTLTATDNRPATGNNRYSVACYNEAGAGFPSESIVWVGPDIPSSPENVSWQPDNDGVVVTWTAPTTGENDGYIDPTAFTYTVVNDVTKEIVANNITGLTCTTKPVLDSSTAQIALSFSVTASNEVGKSRPGVSNITAYGKAYDAPFVESFEGSEFHTSPWLTENENCANYFLPTYDIGVKPYDDDAMLIFGYFSPGITRLCLPIIDLSKLKSPVLKFYAYYLTSTTSFNVVASHDCGKTWQVVGQTVPNTTHERWHMASVDLSSLKGETEARLAIQATSGSYVATPAIPVPFVFIDNVRIEDYPACDLKLTDLTLPLNIQAGKTFNASVTAINNGSTAINGYTVDFSINGVVAKSVECPALKPSEFKDIEIELPLSPNAVGISCVVSAHYEGDVVPENNTVNGTTTVLRSRFPVPTALTNNSTDESRVDLVWNAPQTSYMATLTDDLESYDAGSIGGIDIAADINTGTIGKYKLVDNDKCVPYIVAGVLGSGIPNLGREMACQIIDASMINSESTIWAAHSGNKLFCFWTNQPKDGVVAPNDDYLILPRLAEDDSNISLWAKSLTNKYGLESFEIMVSFTGSEIEDFTTFQTVTNIPAGYKTDPEAGYTFYHFELPEGTVYAAIHYNCTDKAALLIDDITCTPADNEQSLTLVGYNIYRNDTKLNETPVTEPAYTDAPYESADFRYNVTTVFAEGESRYSNSVTAKIVSGIEQISTNRVDRIYAEGTEIVIEGHAGETVSVYTPDGRLIAGEVASETTRIPVASGIYIVKAGNSAVSVAVR